MSGNRPNLHNTLEATNLSRDTTAAPTPHNQSPAPETDERSSQDGTWGERDVGAPIDHAAAISDYEEMRKELSVLSQQRSQGRASIRPSSLVRSATRESNGIRSTRSRRAHSTASYYTEDEKPDQDVPDDEKDFEVEEFLREGRFEKRTEAGGPAKKLGVVYKHLTVMGVGASVTFTKTLPEAIAGTFGPDLYRLICRFVPSLSISKKPPTRTLIADFSGTVRDGEMMLILGRPGSGCSTFLKVIANDRESYALVTGDVLYGGISAEEQEKHYKGEVIYNPEDDQHLPSLTVWQTLKFSFMNKTTKHEAADIPILINALLRMFGISHTKGTLVGNEYVRGISGGERKRGSPSRFYIRTPQLFVQPH